MHIPALAALLLALFSPTAFGANAMVLMEDGELSEVTGQALVEVVKTIGNGGSNGDSGLTFTRIRLGVKATLNANIKTIELGNYEVPWTSDDDRLNSAHVAQDILIQNATLGCVSTTDGDCNAADRYFTVTKPYIEFAYKNDGGPNKELVGLRLGAEGVNGWLGGDILALSGDVYGSGCVTFICGSGEAHDPRGKSLTAVGVFTIDYTAIHRLQLNNTNNFYLGLQKTNVNYPKVGTGPQGVAKPGFWMNLQDGVTIDPADVLTGTRMDNCWKSGATFC